IRVDHDPNAVRAAESVVPMQAETQTAMLTPAPAVHELIDTQAHETSHPQLALAQPKSHAGTNPAAAQPEPQWLTTPDEVAGAIAACPRGAGEFTSTLTFEVRDDGSVKGGRFTTPLFPEARTCVDNVLYTRTKFATPGPVTVPVHIVAR